MNTATVTNHQPARKQLSDQLDRLDGILDALSEGLNGAVTDAVREGTRLAVKDAIVEIMTDATLRTRLHEATAPEPLSESGRPERKPGFWAALKAKARQTAQAVGQVAAHVVIATARQAQALTDSARNVTRALPHLRSLKNLALVGLGAGLTLGLVSYFAPPAVAVVISGVSSAVAASAIHIGIWTRRTVRALSIS